MFRKLTLAGMLVAGLVMALAAPAQAQRSFAPRMFSDQQTHYWRFTVNFNSCVYAGNPGSCSVKVATLPYNAFLVRAYQQVVTAFAGASVTGATVALGTAAASGNIVAAQSVFAITAGTALTVAGLGIGVTGNGIAQTGTIGGFDVFATIQLVGAGGLAATAGQAVYALEYIGPNDGTCAPVPANATAPAC